MLPKNTPRHVAIIMDGNRRWAKQNGFASIVGHKAGLQAIYTLVEAAQSCSVHYVTLFAFSQENWQRPSNDIQGLRRLINQTIMQAAHKLLDSNVKLETIGDISFLGNKVRQKLDELILSSQQNTGLTLNIAINYSGRWDIVKAASSIMSKYKTCDNKIDEELFSQHMCLSHLPDVDLLIRTSGEKRISNFLLWQLAYAELYFSDVLWPNFTASDFELALESFALRNRRFGK